LFDLQADPYEVHNLAGDSRQAARVADMTAQLRDKLKAAGDRESSATQETGGQ